MHGAQQARDLRNEEGSLTCSQKAGSTHSKEDRRMPALSGDSRDTSPSQSPLHLMIPEETKLMEVVNAATDCETEFWSPESGEQLSDPPGADARP